MEKNISKSNIEAGVREFNVDDREIRELLNKRSNFAGKQLRVIKEMKKLQEEYNELQKTISKFNEEIVDLVYKKYLDRFEEFEDIYEVRLVGGSRVVIRLKDAVEEMKKIAKEKFLENKLKWLEKNKK